MTEYIFHIGTNEALAYAEVSSVLGSKSVRGVYKNYMLVETEKLVDQRFLDRLGSIISIFKVLGVAEVAKDNNYSQVIEEYLADRQHESKICFAISSNFLLLDDIESVLKNVKKYLKNLEISCRFILNVTAASLKEAGTFGKNLFGFGFFKFGPLSDNVYFCEMVAIQDIDGYSYRDYSKPYRSAKLGMLPPKLAQIMINLAVGSIESDGVVYDPFCGTGTVLMESVLMGFSAQGSDINEVNVEGTSNNLTWLAEKFEDKVSGKVKGVFAFDARGLSSKEVDGVDFVVTEGFLGAPKHGNESSEALLKELKELGVLYFDFLKSLSKSSKGRKIVVVLVLPVYKGNFGDYGKNFFIENLVDKLPELGYSISALVPENDLGLKYKESVLYKRNDQKVFRQVYRLNLHSKV